LPQRKIPLQGEDRGNGSRCNCHREIKKGGAGVIQGGDHTNPLIKAGGKIKNPIAATNGGGGGVTAEFRRKGKGLWGYRRIKNENGIEMIQRRKTRAK